MDKYSYTCHNCGKDYIPKRRVVQKYCSNSCRTRAFIMKNTKKGLSVPDINSKEPTKIETMSLAGVGNTVAGVAIVKLAENLFISESNKPATKRDIKNLEAKIIKRYYPVKNMPLNLNGLKPYFDLESCLVVYFK